jgi:hypothetical protein
VRSTAAPYTESRLTHLVRNKCVGFPVVEQYGYIFFCWIFLFRSYVTQICSAALSLYTYEHRLLKYPSTAIAVMDLLYKE